MLYGDVQNALVCFFTLHTIQAHFITQCHNWHDNATKSVKSSMNNWKAIPLQWIIESGEKPKFQQMMKARHCKLLKSQTCVGNRTIPAPQWTDRQWANLLSQLYSLHTTWHSTVTFTSKLAVSKHCKYSSV